jgi:hypothetical protein
MTFVALVFAIFVTAMGALGVLAPDRLLGLVRGVQTPAGLYGVAVMRLVFGAAIYLAAAESRAPELLRVFGLITVLAGIVTPFIGLERVGRLIDWWSGLGPQVVRAWAVVALALGLGLAYALFP